MGLHLKGLTLTCCSSVLRGAALSGGYGTGAAEGVGVVFTNFLPSSDGQGSVACIMPSDMESESTREGREEERERERRELLPGCRLSSLCLRWDSSAPFKYAGYF